MPHLVRENSGLFKYEERFKRAFIGILFVHILSVTLAYFGLPDFHFKKRPDLTIELSVMAPSVGGKNNSDVSHASSAKLTQDRPLAQDVNGQRSHQKSSTMTPEMPSGPTGPAVAATSDVDYTATHFKNPKPPYPPLAVKMKQEGKVILLVEVLADGKAGRVRLEATSGYELLDQSALETVKKWQFVPSKKDGIITSQIVRVPITFNLKSR